MMRRWSVSELKRLGEMRDAGLPVPAIAAKLHRSKGAVAQKLSELRRGPAAAPPVNLVPPAPKFWLRAERELTIGDEKFLRGSLIPEGALAGAANASTWLRSGFVSQQFGPMGAKRTVPVVVPAGPAKVGAAVVNAPIKSPLPADPVLACRAIFSEVISRGADFDQAASVLHRTYPDLYHRAIQTVAERRAKAAPQVGFPQRRPPTDRELLTGALA